MSAGKPFDWSGFFIGCVLALSVGFVLGLCGVWGLGS